ncbi:protein of unknown function [Cyanobium sp. NIES-981]|nr:protein of unknown function [Cyanobium sp. NIES-981]
MVAPSAFLRRHGFAMRFGIKGFGRIGRLVCRALGDRPGLELGHSNDTAAGGGRQVDVAMVLDGTGRHRTPPALQPCLAVAGVQRVLVACPVKGVDRCPPRPAASPSGWAPCCRSAPWGGGSGRWAASWGCGWSPTAWCRSPLRRCAAAGAVVRLRALPPCSSGAPCSWPSRP